MISIRALSKQFTVTGGNVTALNDVDLDVAKGELFVIVGASGSGKTTLLRCVGGLEFPERGEIRIADQLVCSNNPPSCIPPQQRRLGMVFQSYAVWPHLTVFENVALPLKEGAQRIPRDEVAGRVHEAMRLVQLEEQTNRSATLLSGGQQQRVALARAIAVNPKVLLMDEPLSNLDARLREEVRGKIRELAKQLDFTVLYVTHDQVEAMAIADKIAIMQGGKLLQVGTPMDLYYRPNRVEVAEFFGQVNWLTGKSIATHRVETPIGSFNTKTSTTPGDEVLLGFRPECLMIVDTPPGTGENTMQANLRSSTFLGDQFTFEMVIREHAFLGKSRAITAHGNGQLNFYVDPANIMIFPASERDNLAEGSAIP